jgi:NADH-quinone oxidoreductase subunit N
MAQFILAFIRSDMVFLILILGLFCSLIYNRGFIGKNNELLSILMLEASKVILFMNTLAYLWDAYLLGSGGPLYYSTGFFFSGFALAFVKAFVVVFSFFVLILAESFFFREGQGMAVEFPLFLLISVFAIFGAIQASDLMTMSLFMEMLSYCLFVMPILYKITNLSLEALLKYFILGSFSSAFLLMGTSLVFSAFGTVAYSSLYFMLSMEADSTLFSGPFAFADYGGAFSYGLFFNLGFIFLFSALFFKLGLVPFHYWVRDVYEGSPLPVVAFFATVVKVPSALVLSKLVFLLLNSF